MKNKHYDCIVAWANGAEVECRASDKDEWEVVKNPIWVVYSQYRIKKEPVIEVKYFHLYIYEDGQHQYSEIIKPDLERWDLKITYQDGKAIKAELPSET